MARRRHGGKPDARPEHRARRPARPIPDAGGDPAPDRLDRVGRKPDRRAGDHAAAADRRPAQRDHPGKWDYVNWERRTLLVPLSKSGKPRAHRAERPGAGAPARDSAPRRQPVHLPLPGQRQALAPRCSSPGTASASAPASPMSGCTICGTPMRASWSTRGSRSTWCRGCSATRTRAPRSATPISRTKPCWRPQSASPTWSVAEMPARWAFLQPPRTGQISRNGYPPRLSLGSGCGMHADSARPPRHKHKFSVNSEPHDAGGLPSRHLGGDPARRNGAAQRSAYSTALILRIRERARASPTHPNLHCGAVRSPCCARPG